MSLAANLAKLAKTLLVQAGGFINGTAPSAGDSSAALITSAWFKGEQATETNQGTAKVATQAVTNAGTDDATFVTPKKLRAGFAISLGVTGYVAFPTWLGGLIIQWGTVSIGGNNVATLVNYPLAFGSAVYSMALSVSGSGGYSNAVLAWSAVSRSQFNCYNASSTGTQGASFIAIGV